MSSWTAGYVLDIPYTSGFYRELAPSFLSFALLRQAVRPPVLSPGATYCELACGQGFGTALLAAANPQTRFWGFDFNPLQIANARRLAAEAGLTNVTFEDHSFEQACALAPDALPAFGVIALHGIYSWISPQNRDFVVRFIERRLKPGGLVYVSYNCMPGWAAMAPLQRLLREHADRHPDRSDVQAGAALELADRLREGGANYFIANPAVAPRMEKLPGMNRSYVAHEYLNAHWHPLYHVDVVREMEPARLTYACSATIPENIDSVSVPAALQPLLAESRDRGWQETLRDYVANKQFRRDLFVRGLSTLSVVEMGRVFGDAAFMAIAPRAAMSFTFQGPLGDIGGQEEIYGPIADAIATRPHTAAELARLPAMAGRPGSALVEVLSLLTHAGHIHPLTTDVAAKAQPTVRAFNKAVLGRLRHGENLGFLAASATGSGVAASYPQMLAALALLENPKITVPQTVDFAWDLMSRTGQRLMKDGKMIQSKEETLPELEEQLTGFFSDRIPVWKTMGVL
jgi:SAM-dependent methyltransferase